MLEKNWLKSVLNQCAALGYRTTPTFSNGKVKPFANGQDYKELHHYRDAVMVGMVLDDLVLLDYDGNKGDVMSVEELEELLDLDLVGMPDAAQVNKAGDSIHWLFKLPKGVDPMTLADANNGAWARIDIKRGNQLMHIKPGKTLNLVAANQWEDCPEALLDKLRESGQRGVAGDDDLLSIIEANEERMPFDKLRELVEGLHPTQADDYDEWYKVGMAIWYETHGSDEGLELFKEFSALSDKYDETEAETKWRTFSNQRGKRPVTGGTLVRYAKESHIIAVKDEVEGFRKRIDQASEQELEIDVIPSIRKADLDDLRRNQLVEVLQGRYKTLTGVKPSKKVVADMVKPVAMVGQLVDDLPRPDWCEPWVWVDSHGAYFHVDHKRVITPQTFNHEFTRNVPPNEQGVRQSADRFVSSNGFVSVADKVEYLPTESARIIEGAHGEKVFNLFDARSLPKFASRFTDEGEQAIKVIREHLAFICNKDAGDTAILEQWLAWQVQCKGQKILWAPLICSIPGVGKTALNELLELLLGADNVGTVSPDDARSKYRGWAQGRCVNVLNELHVAGVNRYEIANAFKPLITDTVITIEEKHVKTTQVRNVTNYLAFTNETGSLPIDENDRRWWPIRTNIDSLDAMVEYTGMDKVEYFDRLFSAIRDHWREIGLWLSEYEISADFRSLRQAPMTQFKADMIATEMTRTDGFESISEIIKSGREGIHPRVILFSALEEAVNADFDNLEPLNRMAITTVLKKMGYTRNAKQIKYDSLPVRVWCKGSYSNDEIREYLDSTKRA